MSEWRQWLATPPDWRKWEVVEWIRADSGKHLDDHPIHVMGRKDAALESNRAWNVAGVYWRPVL